MAEFISFIRFELFLITAIIVFCSTRILRLNMRLSSSALSIMEETVALS